MKKKKTKEEIRLMEVNHRGEIIREVTKTVTATISDTVNSLINAYPEHNKTIRRCLEGEAQRLLAEYEKAKRQASEVQFAKELEVKSKIKAANTE